MLGLSSALHRNGRSQTGQLVGEGFGHLELCLFRAMGIGVGGEVVVAVAEPLLDILHRIVQVQHDGGATVPQIVEANGTQAVLCQDLLELLADEVRLEEHPHLVHADEVQVLPVIAGTAEHLLVELPLPQPREIIVGILTQGQAPAAGLGFGGPFPDGADHTIADLLLDHGCLNVDPAILKVDGRPTQTQKLRSAKSIEAGQEDGYGDGFVLGQGQQLDDLFHGIGLVGLVLDPAGLVRQIRRIIADVLVLHRPLEAAADHRMMLDDRVGAEAGGHLVPVVVLQITGRDAAHRDATFVEVGCNVQLQHVHILIVSGHGNVGPIPFDPQCDMLGQQPVHRLHTLHTLVLVDQLRQHDLGLALIAPNWQVQRDPLLDPLAVLVLEIQNSIILIALDLQTSGHIRHLPYSCC